ncbi:MAG: metalloregulator ArsR/SmtB family transcription factor [Hyphomonadaceae bacterium]
MSARTGGAAARKSAKSASDDREVDAVFDALADAMRRRAIQRLSQGPVRAGDLAKELGLAPPAMSRHLKVLRDAGLVSETHPEFDARIRIYELKSERLDLIRDWLARAEAGWSQQLAAFKKHVEGGQ